VEALILEQEEIRRLVTAEDALDAAREAFAKLARGEVEQPDVLSLDLREQRGDVHVKGAYLQGSPYYVIKVASGFYDNPKRGLPVVGGAVWVFSAETGALRAILLDDGYLTELRTAAAGAVAADVLAARDCKTVAIVGAGGQARHQLAALLAVRRPDVVRVWGRRREAAELYASEMTERTGTPIIVSPSVEAAVEGADLIVTTTPSRSPLVRADWVAPGAHVNAVGADLPGKVELEPLLLSRAKVVADRLEQCRTQGEIAAALEAGALAIEDVHAELGEILVGDKPGRTSSEEITVADFTGVGALDAAMGAMVAERALGSRPGEGVGG
jgi:ectoine utilization protein EutC